MENNSIELSLLDPEEREQIDYIWNLIPAEDRKGMNQNDVLLVLDAMDDYLEEKGLLQYDEQTGEAEYIDGEVDETEQLDYVLKAAKAQGSTITGVQIQLVMDGELQYGIEQGYYEDEE